jgi:hypothetical protein
MAPVSAANLTNSSGGLALAYNSKEQTTSMTSLTGTNTTAMTYAGPTQLERATFGSTTQTTGALGVNADKTGARLHLLPPRRQGTARLGATPDGRCPLLGVRQHRLGHRADQQLGIEGAELQLRPVRHHDRRHLRRIWAVTVLAGFAARFLPAPEEVRLAIVGLALVAAVYVLFDRVR